MIQIDWSKAPEWANFHAFDNDGAGFWYEEKPKLPVSRGMWLKVSGQSIRSISINWINGEWNWKKTLTCRPAAQNN